MLRGELRLEALGLLTGRHRRARLRPRGDEQRARAIEVLAPAEPPEDGEGSARDRRVLLRALLRLRQVDEEGPLDRVEHDGDVGELAVGCDERLGLDELEPEGLRLLGIEAAHAPVHDPHLVEALAHDADDARPLLAALLRLHDVEEAANLGVRQVLHELLVAQREGFLRVVVLLDLREPDGDQRERRHRRERVVLGEATLRQVLLEGLRAEAERPGVVAAGAVGQDDHRLVERDGVDVLLRAVAEVSELRKTVSRHPLDLVEERPPLAVVGRGALVVIEPVEDDLEVLLRLPLRVPDDLLVVEGHEVDEVVRAHGVDERLGDVLRLLVAVAHALRHVEGDQPRRADVRLIPGLAPGNLVFEGRRLGQAAERDEELGARAVDDVDRLPPRVTLDLHVERVVLLQPLADAAPARGPVRLRRAGDGDVGHRLRLNDLEDGGDEHLPVLRRREGIDPKHVRFRSRPRGARDDEGKRGDYDAEEKPVEHGSLMASLIRGR